MAALVLLASCRTNDIAKYPLSNSSILYRTSIAGDAAEVHMDIERPSNDIFSGIATAIGSGVASIEASQKLFRATNPDSLAAGLTLGVQSALSTYFHTRSVASASDNPTYIVEVQLEKYELHSSRSVLYATVHGSARVINAANAKVIWEDDETIRVPLRDYTGTDPNTVLGTAYSILNASNLLSMSDEQLAHVMQQAAEEAGRELGEELREDATGD